MAKLNPYVASCLELTFVEIFQECQLPCAEYESHQQQERVLRNRWPYF